MDPSVLARKQLSELKSIASHLEMRGYQRLKKAELIEAIVRAAGGDVEAAAAAPRQEDEGQLDLASAAGNGDGASAGGARSDEEAGADAARDDDASAGGRSEERDGGARTRVRTRTRERTQDERDADEPAAPGDADEATGRSGGDADGAGAEGSGADGSDADGSGADGSGAEDDEDYEPQRPSGPARRVEPAARAPREDAEDGDDRDDEGGNRRRRSRRERRRNKGTPGTQPIGQRAAQPAAASAPQGGQGGDAGAEVREGVLDVLPEGYGFLRTTGYLPGDRDVYVSQSTIRRHGLRRGDLVSGPIRAQKQSEKVPALQAVQSVNGTDPDAPELSGRPEFRHLTPLFPSERLRLETADGPISMRIVDLLAPIGKGQRGLIVSPPKAGKTTLIKELGQAITRNNPEVHLMVVLVDERPEEVTDMRRSVDGEVIASTFDRPVDDHTQIAELAIERAKRLVELGRDVVVLLDSITRLSRAYNLAAPASGRIMSGGVDSSALYPPKRFFGAARNLEEGGSLTIVATALVDTGSKMDEVIFEEFKGTGNMEVRLDRRLEERRIFPAVDVQASGTRKEELLLEADELPAIYKLRRVLHALDGPAALELLVDRMRQSESNNRFLVQIQKSNLQA
jgi:transcription termination factor Rho